MDTRRVFQFLDERRRRGERTALVTVCAVEGSSMRNPGTHMAVSEDGRFAGSLSGGCIENAVVTEAMDSINDGKSRFVRFGAGSPYLDIKLPCGGGLDLHFQPLGDDEVVRSSCQAIAKRQPFSVSIGVDGAEFVGAWKAVHFDQASGSGVFGHWPSARLQIVGHGAGVSALASLARSIDCDVSVLTPDERVAAELRAQSIKVEQLSRTSDTTLLSGDAWTAFVFLFHDHDWEHSLMQRALDLPHFYIGAMGGRKAHAARCVELSKAGVDESAIATIHAPIGLFHSSRDPQTLALSVLGEVRLAYQCADFKE